MTHTKIEHNVVTDEVLVVPLTNKEKADLKVWQEESAAAQAVIIAQAEEKAAARAALLTRLGITEEEAQLLLGGN
jgi:hypothetical protein